MAGMELLTLDLRSPLEYSGLENPPLSGALLEGRDMEDGEEELFLFDEEELVAFDPDDGPSLRRPLPRPRFYGRRPRRDGVPGASKSDGRLARISHSKIGLSARSDENEERSVLFAREHRVEEATTRSARFCGLAANAISVLLSWKKAARHEKYGLAAGEYVFLQWRPRDVEELMEGLEWFARQAWWERAAAKGPYILRRVREDGRLATQALRRIG